MIVHGPLPPTRSAPPQGCRDGAVVSICGVGTGTMSLALQVPLPREASEGEASTALSTHAGVAWALLTLLCLALFLPGLATIPPVDRDEARFAQASKQMLEGGDFIQPRFQGDDRFNKPIGIYWLQAAAARLTQRPASIWAYRLPSALGALAAVWLTFLLGRRLCGWRASLLGAALLASSPLLIVEAHLATIDAVLLACVVAAQGCLATVYLAAHEEQRTRARPDPAKRGTAWPALGFWVAQGAGILLKGPIVPLVSGLTLGSLMVFDRPRAARPLQVRPLPGGLRWWWGLPVALAMVVPWAVAVGIVTDGRFYREWIADLWPRLVGTHSAHAAPPGFYLLLSGATFWPGCLTVGLVALGAIRRDLRPGERFCLAWLVPTWIFFEIMPTKLPHYVLPTYPALALLTASTVCVPPASVSRVLQTPLVRAGFTLWSVFTLLVGAGVIAAAIVFGSGLHAATVVAAGAALVIAVTGLYLCWFGRVTRAYWMAVIGSVALFAPVLRWVVPDLRPLWLSRDAAVAVAQHGGGPAGARPLAAVGYEEASLVFLAGRAVAFVEAQGAATFLHAAPNGLVLLSDEQRAAFTRATASLGMAPREVWSEEGINYSTGRRTRLRLLER